MKIGAILDQRSEAEVERLGVQQVNKMFEEYRKKRGALPHADVEPTVEQISAMMQSTPTWRGALHRLRRLRPEEPEEVSTHIHTFFNQTALGNARRCLGRLTSHAGGNPTASSRHPSSSSFLTSYRPNTWTTTARESGITTDLYGHACWWLIYQADLRMRGGGIRANQAQTGGSEDPS